MQKNSFQGILFCSIFFVRTQLKLSVQFWVSKRETGDSLEESVIESMASWERLKDLRLFNLKTD